MHMYICIYTYIYIYVSYVWPERRILHSLGLPFVGLGGSKWKIHWTGLDWAGLDWAWLDWTGLDLTGLELDWTELDCTRLVWGWAGQDWAWLERAGTGLDWTGLGWTESWDWTGLDWTGLSQSQIKHTFNLDPVLEGMSGNCKPWPERHSAVAHAKVRSSILFVMVSVQVRPSTLKWYVHNTASKVGTLPYNCTINW